MSGANGITHSPSGERYDGFYVIGFAFGKLRNSAPVSRFVTAFQCYCLYFHLDKNKRMGMLGRKKETILI